MQARIVPHIIQNQTLISVGEGATVREAAALMTDKRIGALMVIEGGTLKGILTERDVMTRVVAKGLNPETTKVAQVMTAKPDTLASHATAGEALERMHAGGYRHLPVVDGGKVVGMVSVRDLYAAVQRQMEREIKDREAYIFGESYGSAN
ncbi:MAG: CBS domain-containing protein [Rhodospirillales bacterium]|nr:CBS domain-containing protein [Rhodospirillales bacterium]